MLSAKEIRNKYGIEQIDHVNAAKQRINNYEKDSALSKVTQDIFYCIECAASKKDTYVVILYENLINRPRRHMACVVNSLRDLGYRVSEIRNHVGVSGINIQWD